MNKSRISILLILVIGVAMLGLVGRVSKEQKAEKKEKATISKKPTAVSTRGWKTYVSKYGFSVEYPANWYLEEEVGGSEGPRLVAQPIYLFDKKGNSLEFGFYSYNNANRSGKIKSEEKDISLIESRVKHLNLIKNIKGHITDKVDNETIYIFYGESYYPKVIYVVSLRYSSAIKDYIVISESINEGENLEEKLKIFSNSIKWVRTR